MGVDREAALPGMRRRRWLEAAAALWGFAEATAFFIVPDVLLSAVAIRDLRHALRCCCIAVAAAVAGGTLMYLVGRAHPEVAAAFLDHLPGINAVMIEEVSTALRTQGPVAMMLGPLSGTPYKVYAVQSAAAGIGIGQFMLASLPARLPRFVVVTLLASLVAHGLRPHAGARGVIAAWAIAWGVFYVLYFCTVGA